MGEYQIKGLTPEQQLAKVLDCTSQDHCVTDVTAFESSCHPILLEIEEQLFRHLCRNQPELIRSFDLMFGAQDLICKNRDKYGLLRLMTLHVGTRRSGVFLTSTGNGLINLGLIMWSAHKHGIARHKVRAIVEGDDGIMPSSLADPPLWRELGFEFSSDLRGNKPGDCDFLHRLWTEHGAVVDVLRTTFRSIHVKKSFGLKKSRQLAILRCVGMSMYYQAPGCPVVTAMVNKIGKHTAGINEFRGIERYLSYTQRKSLEAFGSLSSYPRDVKVNPLLRGIVSEGRVGFPSLLSPIQIYLERLIELSGDSLDIGTMLDDFPDYQDMFADRTNGVDTLLPALEVVGVPTTGYDVSEPIVRPFGHGGDWTVALE